MLGQFERGEQLAEFCLAYMRRHEPHVFVDRAPGQQPRLLEDDPQLAVYRQPHAALEIAVQSDDNAQKRCLAASRWTDQRGDLPIHQGKRDLAEYVQPRAGSGAIALLFDVHIKLA